MLRKNFINVNILNNTNPSHLLTTDGLKNYPCFEAVVLLRTTWQRNILILKAHSVKTILFYQHHIRITLELELELELKNCCISI
jgi:predicted lipid carrier protein YhbT